MVIFLVVGLYLITVFGLGIWIGKVSSLESGRGKFDKERRGQ